ncbi:MAG: hypothetical protein QXX79_01520 [Candidatus Bathyarchaeia archaeon]
MRHTLRALRLIITVLWIVALLLPVAAAFSLLKLLEARNISVQELALSLYNGNLSISIPFCINNTGFYDLTDISVDLQINRGNMAITTVSKQLPKIPAGEMVNSSFHASVSLEEIFSKHIGIVTNDTYLDINTALKFTVAYALTLGIARNFTFHWGAPFNNLTVGDFSYNTTFQALSFSVSFNNHASFPVNGSLKAELYNSANALIGSSMKNLNIASGEHYQELFEIQISDPSNMRDAGFIRLYFADIQILEKWWRLL